MVVNLLKVLFVAQERALVVQVLGLNVLPKPLFVLSLDTASVPLNNQEVLSVVLALAE